MSYELVVRAAWANDPQFQAICKNLWGADVTPEQVIEFSKDGPDVADVHVPGGCKCKKCKGAPVMDNRALPNGVSKASPTYKHLPKANREYKRDHHGRFSSIADIGFNAGVAGTGAVGSGLLGGSAVNDARNLWSRIGAEGVTGAEIAGKTTKLGVLGAGAALLGAAAGFHGREAYEGIKDHAELEREHRRHVSETVRHDDANSYTTGDDPHDLHVLTRGHRRDATTDVHAEGSKSSLQSYRHIEHEKELRRQALPAEAQQYYASQGIKPQTTGDKYRAASALLRKHPEPVDRDDPYTREHDRVYAVHKAAEELTGQLTQIDTDKHQVFGWASIVEKDGIPVVDLQGDYIGIDELEKSAYDYVHKSRIGGAMHRRVGPDGQLIEKKDAPYHAADLIESFVVTPEKIEKMGLPDSTPVGWWVGFKVNDPEVWDSVKSGDWKGFSIHGAGRRKTIGEVSDFDITRAELTA